MTIKYDKRLMRPDYSTKEKISIRLKTGLIKIPETALIDKKLYIYSVFRSFHPVRLTNSQRQPNFIKKENYAPTFSIPFSSARSLSQASLPYYSYNSRNPWRVQKEGNPATRRP
jgi:hypothetical protein